VSGDEESAGCGPQAYRSVGHMIVSSSIGVNHFRPEPFGPARGLCSGVTCRWR